MIIVAERGRKERLPIFVCKQINKIHLSLGHLSIYRPFPSLLASKYAHTLWMRRWAAKCGELLKDLARLLNQAEFTSGGNCLCFSTAQDFIRLLARCEL